MKPRLAARILMATVAVLCCAGAQPVSADDSAQPSAANAAPSQSRVEICYNYGCYVRSEVEFAPWQLAYLDRLFANVNDAETERSMIARAVGRMYFFAGSTTPIWHDHGLNYKDNGADGMMDCIDHSHNTNEFLLLLKDRGLLRFHDVRGKLRRTTLFFADHWTARVAERATGAEYAVDSWFGDPGEPAAVMPVADWLHRKDPNG